MPEQLNSRTIRVVKDTYTNVEALLREKNPDHPVYCIYPHVYEASTREFVEGFVGRVLFAVKANNHPKILQVLQQGGVQHFDCASMAEIELVATSCPDSTSYFMNPVRFPGDARIAQQKYGVRHFVVDDLSGLGALLAEIDAANAVIFARIAVSHESATQDLSFKFGAAVDDIPTIIAAIAANGAEPAVAFNVGTSVKSPEAYAHAIGIAREVLRKLPMQIRLLDIGGGFPTIYPDFSAPAIKEFIERANEAGKDLPLSSDGELMAEPGRALSSSGMSTVTRVLLRKPDSIYLNDGLYGSFWELTANGHLEYPLRVFRQGQPHAGETKPFSVYGPTCDSADVMPTALVLPIDISVGDHIEFGTTGAYSLSGRTDFNGFYSDDVVTLSDTESYPPRMGD
tara:strand:+ start:3713 stop:4906 length:1194 start_codon:yes stop_codon:yes gene_type:complete